MNSSALSVFAETVSKWKHHQYESATLQSCSVALCVSLRGNIVEESLFFLGKEEAAVGVSHGTIGEMREKA